MDLLAKVLQLPEFFRGLRKQSGQPAQTPARRKQSCPLDLEQLEDRLNPSKMIPLPVPDDYAVNHVPTTNSEFVQYTNASARATFHQVNFANGTTLAPARLPDVDWVDNLAHALNAPPQGPISDEASIAWSTAPAVQQAALAAATEATLTWLDISAGSLTVPGELVTITVTVAPVFLSASTPTGTVDIKDNGATIGSVTLAPQPDGSATASFATSSLALGSHEISADYLGDPTFLPSSGGAVLDVIQVPTDAFVGSSHSGSVPRENVTLTATVNYNIFSVGFRGAPSGTVVFKDNGMTIGSGMLTPEGPNTESSTADLITSFTTLGTHEITVEYLGDPVFLPSSYGPLSQLVFKDEPAIGIGSDPLVSSEFGQPVTILALVSPNVSVIPTGQVEFFVDDISVGTSGLAPVPNEFFAEATFVISTLSEGNHNFTAVYLGSDQFLSQTSSVLGHSVSPAPPTPEAATHLAFSVQPPSTTPAGEPFSVTVQALDDFDNVDTAFSGDITVSIGTNPSGGTLTGTLTVMAVDGEAVFNDLSIDKAGMGYTLLAASGTLPGDESGSFAITAAAAHHLAFAQQPSNTVAGDAIDPAVTVFVEDRFDNLVVTSTAEVTMAIGANPGGGTLSGTLTVKAVDGVATFRDLSIDKIGTNYTLVAASGTLLSAESFPFDIMPDWTQVRLELDVDGNSVLGDQLPDGTTDGVQNYTPGYRGVRTAIETRGRNFGQKMRLVLTGIGLNDGVDSVTFTIVNTTRLEGFSGNETDRRIMGNGKDADFSFASANDLNTFTVVTKKGTADGMLEGSEAWVAFWAKDYGGKATVQATFTINGIEVTPPNPIELTIPVDADGNGIADVWEQRILAQWNALYGARSQFFDATEDDEPKDPDGNGPLEEQKTTGDHIRVLEEYRGFHFDGPFTPGHVRLSPVLREVLFEVDKPINEFFRLSPLPPGGIRDYLEVATDTLAKAGIRAFWKFEGHFAPWNANNADFQNQTRIQNGLEFYRGSRSSPSFIDLNYKRYFTHVAIVRDMKNVRQGNFDFAAFAVTEVQTDDRALRDRMGLVVMVDRIPALARAASVSNKDYGGVSLAHEFLHMVISPRAAIWDALEHLISVALPPPFNPEPPNSDELMLDNRYRKNSQLATVVIGRTTQIEISLSNNPTLHPLP